MGRQIAFFVVCLATASRILSAGDPSLDDVFARTTPGEPTDGLRLHITTDKDRYFLGEPACLYLRIINTTDKPKAVSLSVSVPLGMRLMLRPSVEPGQRWPLMFGSGFGEHAFIPAKGRLDIAIPEVHFRPGATSLRIVLVGNPAAHALPFGEPWTGQLTSNAVRVDVYHKDPMSEDEKKALEQGFRWQIDLFNHLNEEEAYQAQTSLVYLSEYSLPVLLEALRSESALIRYNVVQALSRIADRELADDKGFQRQVHFLGNLLRAYDGEEEGGVRARLMLALRSFSDATGDDRERIVAVLIRGTNDPDADVRREAILVLFGFDPRSAIPPTIAFLKDSADLGPKGGDRHVYDRLKKATGQVFAPDDHARWQRWWEDVKRGEKAPDPAK